MPFRVFASHTPTRALLSRVLVASRLLVLLIVAAGALALIGSATGLARLSAPLSAWRPMLPGSSACCIGLGIALWARIEEKRGIALGASIVVLAISLAALTGVAAHVRALVDLSPLPSTILTTTASFGLLLATLQHRQDLEKITLGVTGLALVALSVTITFAHTIGIFDGNVAGAEPGSSLQLVVGSLLLGLCFIGLVWASGFEDVELPEWLPGAAGLASLITVMSLWSALVERERAQRVDTGRQAAIAEARVFVRGLENGARSIRRTADLAASGVTDMQLQHDFAAQLRDVSSLESIHLIGADSSVRTDYPPTANGAVVRALWQRYTTNGHALGDTRSEAAIDARGDRPSVAAVATHGDTLVWLALDSGITRFVVYAPICAANNRCNGVVAGVFRSAELYRPIVNDTLNVFRFAIAPSDRTPEWLSDSGSGNGSAGGSGVHTTPDATQELRVGGLHWTMAVWRDSVNGAAEANLPGAILFMGLVVTLLLPTTLQLGRSAWEGAREREHARLSMALDRSTDGIWEMDLLTGASKRSTSLLRHLQYTADTMPSGADGWSTLIHPADRAAVEAALSRHLSGESDSFEAEYRVRAADESWHQVVDRGRIVDRTALGEPSKLLGISADVTEARAIAKAREESEQRFRTLFNSSFQFQLLLDGEFRVLEVNRVALDHARVVLDDVLHCVCWDALWWRDHAAARAALRAACEAAAQGESRIWEQEFVAPGRPPLLLELSLKPIQRTQEHPSQYLLEGRDVTERRRAEALLTEVETLTTMGRLAARVAHEINNPLAGIQNAFLLIKDAVPPEHKYFRYVGSIEREIERISDVTRQLYETYRPERDNSRLASLQVVVTDAVSFLEQVNRSRNFHIVTELSGLPVQVPVPAAMLRQIVYNLVQNAIDASPPGGTVTVTAVADTNTIALHVGDQGPGIPEELTEQIFEQFFTTKGTQVKTSGMGLGLALVRRTVAAAGGSITVNTSKDHGTEFIVTLPLQLNRDGAHRDGDQS